MATGTYTDVHMRPRRDISTTGVVTQVVYISKTVTIRGGYATTFTDPPDPVSNPTILDAQEEGRVLYITGNISPTIEGLQLMNGKVIGLGGNLHGSNTDRDAGGGVYIISATVNMTNNQISNNTAGRVDISAIGGGLYFFNSANVTLISNTITNNVASSNAAGVTFLNGPGARLATNIIRNNAVFGGGLSKNGGAYFVNSDNVLLIGNTVSDNFAQNGCGGLCFSNATDLTLDSNTVISNYAGDLGDAGGISIDDSNALLINNAITDNQAGTNHKGSGLYIWRSSVRLLHTTIARNIGGDGSGVYITDDGMIHSTVALTNTILVSQSVGITVTAGNTATLDATLWGDGNWANTIDWTGAGTVTTGTINIYGDPDFVDPDNGNYHIAMGSAAIDTGLNTGVTTDIDGDPRPDGCGVDIGFDESQNPPLFCNYLPVILKELS